MFDYIDDLVEAVKIYGIILVIFLCVAIPVFFVVNGISRYECKAYGDVTGLKTKFAAFTCYVNYGDKYIPYAEYMKKDVGNKIIIDTKGE